MMADTGGISVFTQWRLPENVASIRSLRRETFGFLLAASHSICLMLSLKFCSSSGSTSSVASSNLFGPFFCRFDGGSTGRFSLSLTCLLDGRRMCFSRSLTLIFQEPCWVMCVCVMPKGYRRWGQYTYLHAMSCISKVDKYIPVEQYKCIHTD